jgi:hypothetical protein
MFDKRSRPVGARRPGRTHRVAMLAMATGAAAFLASAASAQTAAITNGAKLAAQERQACSKNLKAIYAAIQAFQADRHDLPNWLSDLVPQYLPDANVLTCPTCRRTGQAEAPPLTDPKLPSSYLFEFCPVPLGQAAPGAPTRTRREWKRRQMELVGLQVPLVRCRHHRPVLNLGFDGTIYGSPPSWELLFTNKVSAADLTGARIFADEPARAPKAPKKAGRAEPAEPATGPK